MITDAIIDFFFAFVRDLVQLLPDWEMPPWLDNLAQPVGLVMGYGSTLGAWLPTHLALVVFTALIVANGVAFAIKAVRIVASFFTAGGGSAA